MLNRLLTKLGHSPLHVDDHKVQMRFSAGLTQWREGETAEALIEGGDKALYRAKQGGRARVEVSEA